MVKMKRTVKTGENMKFIYIMDFTGFHGVSQAKKKELLNRKCGNTLMSSNVENLRNEGVWEDDRNGDPGLYRKSPTLGVVQLGISKWGTIINMKQSPSE